MDLIEKLIDSQFKTGETVYHKPSGMVGRIICEGLHDNDISFEPSWCNKLLLVNKKDLTHKLPRLAKPKHIYKYCPLYIIIVLNLMSIVTAILCVTTSQTLFSSLGSLSNTIIVFCTAFDKSRNWLLSHKYIILVYCIYLMLLSLTAIKVILSKQ